MSPFLDGFSIILDSSNALQMIGIYDFVSLCTSFGVAKASVDQKEERIWGRKSMAEDRVSPPTIDKERAVDADWGNFHYQIRGSVVHSNLIISCRCETLSRRRFLLSPLVVRLYRRQMTSIL
jgi:hypothetical protein